MRILFSIYKEDRDSERVTFLHRECITTDLTIQDIDKKLNLYDGFHYNLTVGQTISFWDIYCFFDEYDQLIRKIVNIPRVEENTKSYKPCKVLLKEDYDPGIVGDAKLPNFQKTFLFELNRYECGANSYEALVYWISNHPMEFTIIYDAFKYIIKKVFNGLKIKSGNWLNKSHVYLNEKAFYKNFSNTIRLKKDQCQIIAIHMNDRNNLDITVRTITGDRYYVKSNARGKIIEMNIEE